MLTKNIVNEELASFNYYKNATPLYLQNTYGIIEHERLLYDTLINNYSIDNTKRSSLVSSINAIFNSFNIFSINDDSSFDANAATNYLRFLDSLQSFQSAIVYIEATNSSAEDITYLPDDLKLEDNLGNIWQTDMTLKSSKNSTQTFAITYAFNGAMTSIPQSATFVSSHSDLTITSIQFDVRTVARSLELLATYFGISASEKVTYKDDNQEDVTEVLTLNNSDMLTYVKCRAIRNFFNGTYENLKELYASLNLPIMALTTDTSSLYAEADVYLLLSYENEVSDNIKKLFKAGKLFIESLGIKYNYAILIATNILTFDSTDSAKTIDNGRLVI